MAVRSRIVRFLHAELGFTVLAFESSLFLCHLGDVTAPAGDPSNTLTRSLIGVWHTEEVLPLFAYMKSTRSGIAPLRLAGFDVQPIGSGRRERPAFFERVVAVIDPKYAQEVLDLDRRFNAEYEKGTAARRAFLRSNAAELGQSYERLAQFIQSNLTSMQQQLGREVPLIARQEARSMAAYVRQQAAAEMKDYAEIRDKAMADNLAFIADELFPGQKVVVWGHNYHVRHDNAAIPPRPDVFPGVAARSMGGWVRERYGDRVYTIGQYEVEGEAADNSRKPYAIAKPPDGSLEHRLNTGAAVVVHRPAHRIASTGQRLAPPTNSRTLQRTTPRIDRPRESVRRPADDRKGHPPALSLLSILAHRPSPIAHRPSPIAHRPSPIAHRPSPIAPSYSLRSESSGLTRVARRAGSHAASATAAASVGTATT